MQPYGQPQQVKIRKPVLIFLKVVGPPIVLYTDDSETLYDELVKIITEANEKSPKLIEKTAKGPVKKLAVLDTQIAGVAIQEENYTA
jgi:hypothetical protein